MISIINHWFAEIVEIIFFALQKRVPFALSSINVFNFSLINARTFFNDAES